MFLGGFAALKVFRLIIRLVTLVVVAAIVYFAFTSVQVWLVSRKTASEPAQAAVVVGGSENGGTASAGLMARLETAQTLVERHLVSYVVVSGGVAGGKHHSVSQVGLTWLESAGVPASELQAVGGSGMWGGLEAAAKALSGRGDQHVLVVTEGFDEDRALAIASGLGLDAQGYPVTSSPVHGASLFEHIATEGIAVGVGRIIGYAHLHELHGIFG